MNKDVLYLFTQCNALDGKCIISCDNEVNVILSFSPLGHVSMIKFTKPLLFNTHSLYNDHSVRDSYTISLHFFIISAL